MANTLSPASYDDLVVFLVVVQTGGFRDAARKMNVAPSTVSETISRLETRLGLRLLQRTTRAVTPTEAGTALANRIRPLMMETASAVTDAMSSAGEVRGPLRLNVPGAVMVDILPPLVDRFLARHPEVTLDIVVDDRFVDVLAGGFDAGVRYGERLAQDMIAVPLGPSRQCAATAAAPSWIARHGTPDTPQDLIGKPAIQLRFVSGALTGFSFEKDGQELTIEPEARLTLSTTALPAALQAAADGIGAICTFGNWLEPEFAAGRLVPILRDWWPRFDGPRLYFSSRRHMPAPLRAFVDLVAEDRRTRQD